MSCNVVVGRRYWVKVICAAGMFFGIWGTVCAGEDWGCFRGAGARGVAEGYPCILVLVYNVSYGNCSTI